MQGGQQTDLHLKDFGSSYLMVLEVVGNIAVVWVVGNLALELVLRNENRRNLTLMVLQLEQVCIVERVHDIEVVVAVGLELVDIVVVVLEQLDDIVVVVVLERLDGIELVLYLAWSCIVDLHKFLDLLCIDHHQLHQVLMRDMSFESFQ